MRRIKKFNESVEEGFDIEYIKHCFADLNDEFGIEVKEIDAYYNKNLQIVVELPRLNGRIAFNDEEVTDIESRFGLNHSISDLITASENLNKILELVDISVKRLSDEHPEYKFSNNDIDVNHKSKIQYRTKSDGDKPKLFITISK